MTPNKISMRITLTDLLPNTHPLGFLRMKTFSFAGARGRGRGTNNVPALYADPIPASFHSHMKERY